MERSLLLILIFILSSGCITQSGSQAAPSTIDETPVSPAPTLDAVTTVIQPAKSISGLDEEPFSSPEKNKSVAVEVNYRDYVDWFKNHNVFIRAYTPEEYVCGQYTVDMINDSEEAGFKAYFAVVTFSDGTGHALVSFKSTVTDFTSWYFFEPQTNKQMTTETLDYVLNRNMGKKVKEVTIYGYFDDAEDNDPATWRFADPFYNKKY